MTLKLAVSRSRPAVPYGANLLLLLLLARVMGQYCFAGWHLSLSSVMLPEGQLAGRRPNWPLSCGRLVRQRPGTWVVGTAGQYGYVPTPC